MARVKKAVNAKKYRKNLLSQVKGYRFARSKKEKAANEAMFHAGSYAFAHRRDKKSDFRKLWNVKINAGLRSIDPKYSYSKFIGALKKAGMVIDRKSLATLAETHPRSFGAVVKKVMA